MSRMKIIIIALAGSGFALLLFGLWGIYTPAGRTRFDEMDGIYPMIAAAVGIADILAAIVMTFFFARKSSGKN